MAARELDRSEWTDYFDNFSRQHLDGPAPRDANIEVLAPEVGAQEKARFARLKGISYDPKGNALEISLEGNEHRVYRPTQIWVEEEEGFLRGLEVKTDDGTREIVEVQRVGIERAPRQP